MANRNFTSQFTFSFEKQMANLVGAFTKTSDLLPASLVNQGITYTAATEGSAGNDISIELVDPGNVDDSLSISVVGNAISVSLESAAAVAATLTNQGITYTAVAAGAAGNSITITLVDPMGNNEPLAISVVGTDISVSLETDGGGLIVSDADAVVAAITADMDASALITATGTGSSPLTALSQTPLADGADHELLTSKSALVSAINADMDASALISASGSGGTILTALAETSLSGGSDSAFSSNLPIEYMSLSEDVDGELTLTLADKYIALLSASVNLQCVSLSDLFVQIASEDVDNTRVIELNTFAIGSGTPVLTSMAVGDVLYVDLKLRNVR